MRPRDPIFRLARILSMPLRNTAAICLTAAAIVVASASAPAAVLTETDNLVTHFDAALGTYTDNGVTPASDGDLVQWWDDQALDIAGNNAAQQSYAKPTLVANGLNDLPVIHFSGAQNLLVLDQGAGGSSSAMGAALDTNTISWFAVVSKDSPVATESVLRAKTNQGDNRWGSFYQSGQYFSHSRTSAGGFVGPGIPAPTDSFVVLSAVWDGADPNTTVQQWVNGSASSVATGATQTGTFDRFRIGAGSDGGSNLHGDVAEVLVYNAALSGVARRNVEDYLYMKYFVPGPPRVNDYPLATGLRLHATGDAADIVGLTVLDTAGIPQNGTIQVGGNPALNLQNVPGILGQAAKFSGSDNDYVDFGDVFDPGADSFTVSLWFNADDTSGVEFLVGKGNPSSASVGWSIWMDNDDLVVRGQQNSATNADRFGQYLPDALTAGEWYNVVMVLDRDADTIRGYLNGSDAGWLTGGGGSVVDSLIPGSTIDAAESLLVGRRWTTGAPFSGLIDDLAIWERALSPEEIEYLYNKGLIGLNAATVPEPSAWAMLLMGAATVFAAA